jgi:hypothetical protein
MIAEVDLVRESSKGKKLISSDVIHWILVP